MRFTRAFLFVILVTTVAVGARALLSDPEHVKPDHVAPPVAEALAPLPLAAVGGDLPDVKAMEEWFGGVARAEWYAGVEAELERQASEAAARAGARSSGGGGGSCAGDVACFLECTRGHESDTSGGYAAVNPNGHYGAYQFSQATWDAAVAGAGHAEYVGMRPDQVPPEIQDAAAAHLYGVSGNRPWEGRC